jgi:hypothetical protein
MFTRVGLRLQFAQIFKSRQDAADFVISSVSFPSIRSAVFNITGRALDPEIAYRFEDEKFGVNARLKAQEVTLDFSLPMGFEDLARSEKRSFAFLDIDYYTTAPITVTVFDGPALIAKWLHLIRRDSGRLFVD